MSLDGGKYRKSIDYPDHYPCCVALVIKDMFSPNCKWSRSKKTWHRLDWKEKIMWLELTDATGRITLSSEKCQEQWGTTSSPRRVQRSNIIFWEEQGQCPVWLSLLHCKTNRANYGRRHRSGSGALWIKTQESFTLCQVSDGTYIVPSRTMVNSAAVVAYK